MVRAILKTSWLVLFRKTRGKRLVFILKMMRKQQHIGWLTQNL